MIQLPEQPLTREELTVLTDHLTNVGGVYKLIAAVVADREGARCEQ
jgi:hypothetical protein